MGDAQPRNVLWTSGWDSTFRVATLVLTEGCVVQPWYVKDSGRRSTKTELRTMESLRSLLEQRDASVRERLLPTKVFEMADIPADDEVTRKHRSLVERSFLGNQYDWLSRFAQWQGITLELCIHRDDKAHGFLEEAVERDDLGMYRLSSGTNGDLTVFAPFVFPLFDTTKREMQCAAEAGGFADVLEETWFCFNPTLRGEPCSRCNPCRYTRDEGLGRRVPPPSPMRTVQALSLEYSWIALCRVRAAAQRLRGTPR
ncbi:7-cyano-7-deazaguanine synthase [Mycobacterium sp. SMC-4]|uniref:7-cyano-7-deazaguanine synthase n=1 Tax=Mycobacterium sp. SMC-4 TaxID=2857059 RepID=UPI003D07334C